MKRAALLMSTLLILSGCKTAPTVQVMQVCPALPPLEMDAPGRDYTGEMRSFLSGSLPTPPAPKVHSTSAE